MKVTKFDNRFTNETKHCVECGIKVIENIDRTFYDVEIGQNVKFCLCSCHISRLHGITDVVANEDPRYFID